MAFESGRRVRRSPDVAHRLIDGEAVLLDLKTGRYFGLNVSGSVTWEALGDSGATVAEIFAIMRERFEASDDVLRRDLDELLTTLAKERLVVLDP